MANPVYGNALDMIGNTPLIAVRRLDTGPCQLFLKLESQNPGGSIKDRIGLYLIEAAERAGKIKPGGTLIEATAGNTGLGLALVAAQKGYRLLLVIPDKRSQEKIFHLKAMGAEVMMTRSDVSKGHPEYYRDVAERLARETPDCHFVNQFGNPANAQAHEETTAPEIWEQMDHRLDAVVCGVGAALLPGADALAARRDLRLRQRQQVSLQGLQRLLDARSGIPRARALRGSARSHRSAALGARRGDGELDRDGDCGLPPHEALRRLAGAGDAGRAHRRHRGRGGHPARGHRQPRALQRAGDGGDGEPPGDGVRRCSGVAAHGDLQARHGGDRHARQRVSGADHPHRPAQLAAAQDVRQTRRSTCAYAINGFAMSDETAGQRFATRVIHGGQRPDPLTGAVMPPIYATSTYVQSSPGVHRGFDYSRTRNPTRDALQAALASLEGGAAGFAFASGMAAIATILELLDAGSHIVAMHDLYGGSYRLLENVRSRSAGHRVSFVDLSESAAPTGALRPDTRMVWASPPTP